ncbi:hypothetical protein [uncultured Bacteroides sp.]|nr:hypothetical protein [uncultured Bacteroides sp.]
MIWKGKRAGTRLHRKNPVPTFLLTRSNELPEGVQAFKERMQYNT